MSKDERNQLKGDLIMCTQGTSWTEVMDYLKRQNQEGIYTTEFTPCCCCDDIEEEECDRMMDDDTCPMMQRSNDDS